jgi:hypothetical protein
MDDKPSSLRYQIITDVLKYSIIVGGGVFALGQVSGKVAQGFDEQAARMGQMERQISEAQRVERSDIQVLTARLDTLFDGSRRNGGVGRP